MSAITISPETSFPTAKATFEGWLLNSDLNTSLNKTGVTSFIGTSIPTAAFPE